MCFVSGPSCNERSKKVIRKCPYWIEAVNFCSTEKKKTYTLTQQTHLITCIDKMLALAVMIMIMVYLREWFYMKKKCRVDSLRNSYSMCFFLQAPIWK